MPGNNYQLKILYKLKVRNSTARYALDTTVGTSEKINNFRLVHETRISNINGFVSIYDFKENGQLIPAEKANVFIGNGFMPTISNYSYSTITAGDGGFLFADIPITDKAKFQYYFSFNYGINAQSIPLESQITDTLQLSQVTLSPRNLPGIVAIKIVDRNSTPQPNVDICVFANHALFINSQKCGGSIFSGKTNIYGKVFLTSLQPSSRYYIKGKLDSTNLSVSDSINVSLMFPQNFVSVLK